MSDEQSLRGNAFAQSVLGAAGGGEGADTDLDCDEPMDPDFEAFLAESFAVENHVPSTGRGCFDAAYNPRAGVLQITLRLGFDFTAAEDAGVIQNLNGGGWVEAEKRAWIGAFVSGVEAAWAIDHPIRCIRPGWCLEVMPVVKIVPVDWGTGHYDVTVRRKAGSEVRPSVRDKDPMDLPGGTAQLEENDIRLGIASSGVEDAEKERVLAFNEDPITFDLAADAAALTPAGKARLQAISSDLANRPPGTPSLAVVVAGWGDSGDQNASWDAVSQVAERLPKHPHRFDPDLHGANPVGQVTFVPDDHHAATKYEDRFMFAAHEVGHMLGLPDEYEDSASSPDFVAAHDALVESAGLEKVERNVDTSSVMALGGDVLPPHLVTFREVLGQMTASYLSPDEWRF